MYVVIIACLLTIVLQCTCSHTMHISMHINKQTNKQSLIAGVHTHTHIHITERERVNEFVSIFYMLRVV